MANIDNITTPVLKLKNDRLLVEIATPRGSVQRGTRFDLTAHVIQVTLDGRHTYCVAEAFNDERDTGGLGLCNEFIGYGGESEKAPEAGKLYPKLGIGILDYIGEGEGLFSKKLVHAPYPITVTGAGIDAPADSATLMFTAEPVECDGYAVRLVKTVTIRDNALIIAYEMENTGAKTLRTREYNHNFVQIDGQPIGPEYVLKFPHAVSMVQVPEDLELCGNEVHWNRVPPESFFCLPTGFSGKGHVWELLHTPSGVGMREIDDFTVEHIALWGRKHVVSPEIFNYIELAPGEKAKWTRRYEFFC